MKKTTIGLILLLVLTISFAQAQKQIPTNPSSKPFVLGEIQEIQSTVLGEKRILNIYLPEGYHSNDTVKYPVVYLLDGSADEDFIHVTGLFQFNNFSWINRVPKSIIVGIANVDRRRDFTFPTTIVKDKQRYPTAGHSTSFIKFLETELQPYIEKQFKTTSDKMLIGQSLAGLFATEVLLKKPGLFNKYIIISPSLWWNNGSLLEQTTLPLQNATLPITGIYIGVGKEGLSPGDTPRVMEVDANLLAEKITRSKNKQLQLHFDYLPQEDHATITHQAIFNALRLLYPAKQ